MDFIDILCFETIGMTVFQKGVFMMDEFKRLNQDIYNDFAIGCKYFVRNHGSDERNKKMARKIARRRLKMKDKINLREEIYASRN